MDLSKTDRVKKTKELPKIIQILFFRTGVILKTFNHVKAYLNCIKKKIDMDIL